MSSHSRTASLASFPSFPSIPSGEAKSPGVYDLNNFWGGENFEKYRKNGLHPVEIDEYYHHNKYRIVHRLGAGGASTVWVAQNTTDKQLYALKFLSSNASAKSHESEKTQRINKILSLRPVTIQYVDSFQFQGPNCSSKGMNKVLVFDLHGPSIMQLSHHGMRMHSSVLQKVMHNTTKALANLHKAGIVHLDLTPNNVLLKLDPKIRHLSPALLYAKFGQPESNPIRRRDGKDPRPLAPQRCYERIDFNKAPELLYPETVLIDFNESDESRHKKFKPSVIPSLWAAPEAIFENKVDPSCDIWSLGCIIYRARAGMDLFPGSFFGVGQTCEVAHQMVQRLGPPPLAHWKAARYSEKYDRFTLPARYKLRSTAREVKTWIQRESDPECCPPLETAVRRIQDHPTNTPANKIFWNMSGEWGIPDEDLVKCPHISSKEADLLYDLLSKIFVWDPAKRITAAQLLKHPWFQFHKH